MFSKLNLRVTTNVITSVITSDLELQIARQNPSKRENIRPGSGIEGAFGVLFLFLGFHSTICSPRSEGIRFVATQIGDLENTKLLLALVAF